MKENKVEIYTDGSCDNNSELRIGSHAFVCISGEDELFRWVDWNKDSTNNREELCAVIKGIEWLNKEKDPVTYVDIITDSYYVKTGLEIWMHAWAKKDFRTCKNSDLWEKAYRIVKESRGFGIKWVPGHSNHKWNDLAHKLCYDHRKSIVEKINSGKIYC